MFRPLLWAIFKSQKCLFEETVQYKLYIYIYIYINLKLNEISFNILMLFMTMIYYKPNNMIVIIYSRYLKTGVGD